MPPKHRKPLCRFVSTSVFQSPAYLLLPEDGQARFLFLFLLLHPFGGTFHTPGVYQVGPEALREAARMPRKAFVSAYTALLKRQVLEEDPHWRLLWLPAALDVMGPPSNPNIVKGICRSLGAMPACQLMETAKRRYLALLQPLGEAFVQPFREAFGEDDQTLPDRLPEQNRDRKLIQILSTSNQTPQQGSDTHSQSSTVSLGDLRSYLCEIGWDCPKEKAIEGHYQQVADLKWSEIQSGREVVDARSHVADPVAYLFGVIRAMRSDARTDVSQVNIQQEDFRGFSDGERVSWKAR